MTDESPPAPAVHLNLNVRGLPPSATVAINDRSNRLLGDGRDVVKLGLGQSPFPVPDPVRRELERCAGEKDYLEVRGLRSLREAVAAHHRRHFDLECCADDVLIGPGSKELMFLLQLVYYGDLVIPTPCWVSYAPQARIIGRHIRMLPTRPEAGWKLTPRQLDALCREDPSRPRLVVLNYPSNPTGTTYREDELAEIAEVARRYQLLVLSDEIYGKLNHDGRHRSIAPLHPRGTIFSGGLSKWCGAGGWRLGVFVVPPAMRWLVEAMAAVGSETYTSTSAPIQHAAVRAFQDDPEIDDYLVSARMVLQALGRRAARTLERAGARVAAPEGGFYLFPDFSPLREELEAAGIRTSDDLCERALDDTGVAFLPGTAFGRDPAELNARLAYVDFDGAAALQAVQRIGTGAVDDAFLERYCARTVAGIERLAEWIAALPQRP